MTTKTLREVSHIMRETKWNPIISITTEGRVDYMTLVYALRTLSPNGAYMSAVQIVLALTATRSIRRTAARTHMRGHGKRSLRRAYRAICTLRRNALRKA